MLIQTRVRTGNLRETYSDGDPNSHPHQIKRPDLRGNLREAKEADRGHGPVVEDGDACGFIGRRGAGANHADTQATVPSSEETRG